ncbi:MAG: hypothetical protein LBD82_02090 [Deltaproteobacteria bacterium]|jgi:hypothetical protein|nr:hypothetical protein [Deltaproteobacteria bacterium]
MAAGLLSSHASGSEAAHKMLLDEDMLFTLNMEGVEADISISGGLECDPYFTDKQPGHTEKAEILPELYEDTGNGGISACGRFRISGEPADVSIALGGQDTGLTLPGASGHSIAVTLPEGHPCAGDTLSLTNSGNGCYVYRYVRGRGIRPDIMTHTLLELDAVWTDGEKAHAAADIRAHTAPRPLTLQRIILEETPAVNYYVTILLDISAWAQAGPPDNPHGLFNASRNALLDLFDEYRYGRGCVKINLVLFDSAAAALAGAEMNAGEAARVLRALPEPARCEPCGALYDKALEKAVPVVLKGLTDTRYKDSRQQVFFISGIAPAEGHGVSGTWVTLVNDPRTEKLDIYSLGVGPGTSAREVNLKAACCQYELNASGGDQYILVDKPHDLGKVVSYLADIAPCGAIFQNMLGEAAHAYRIFSYFDLWGTEQIVDWDNKSALVDGCFRLTLADNGLGGGAWLDVRPDGGYALFARSKDIPYHYDDIKITALDEHGGKLVLSCAVILRRPQE